MVLFWSGLAWQNELFQAASLITASLADEDDLEGEEMEEGMEDGDGVVISLPSLQSSRSVQS